MGLNKELYKLGLRDLGEESVTVQSPVWCIEYWTIPV